MKYRKKNRQSAPRAVPLTVAQILAWADEWHRRRGAWPKAKSGPIPDAPGETWCMVANALSAGKRGLPGDCSLAQLLDRHRGVPNVKDVPRLTVPVILGWADAHHRRTGAWPQVRSGPIHGVLHTSWMAVECALSRGGRGLPGGSSLRRLLVEHGRIQNPH